MPKAIETIELTYVYSDGTVALEGVNFAVERGEKVVLLGPNGAGKSTLLYHFNGLLTPTKGKVYVLGREVSKANLDFVRQKVGLVFQNPDDQLFAPTVFHDIAFGPRNIGLPEDEVKERVKWAIEVMGLKGLENKPPHRLSHGQKKRVAIAGVLAMKPEIIALDEPMAGLDPRTAHNLLDLLIGLNKEYGITLIIATHDVDIAPLFSDRVYVLGSGRICLQGRPAEVFSNAKAIRNIGLRLPRIAHLFEILKAKDGLPVRNDLPLTIGEARREIRRLLSEKVLRILC
jgi:cobalt/nickel transport system ATP-binding protein